MSGLSVLDLVSISPRLALEVVGAAESTVLVSELAVQDEEDFHSSWRYVLVVVKTIGQVVQVTLQLQKNVSLLPNFLP